MLRRGIGFAALLGAVLALVVAPAEAVTEGPQLGFVRTSQHSFDLETTDASGAGATSLAGSGAPGSAVPFFLSPPTWSGDGGSLLYSGAVVKKASAAFAPRSLGLYAVPAAGGPPALVPHTADALYPIGFADGQRVAVVKIRGPSRGWTTSDGKSHETRARNSLWIVRLDGGAARRVTPWSEDVEDVPTSVSPDGGTLAISRIDIRALKSGKRHPTSALLLDLATGQTTPVGPGIASAIFSPDGSRLAVVREVRFPQPHTLKSGEGTFTVTVFGQTDVYVEDLTSGAMTPVSLGPASDYRPSWDPSGQRLSFVREGNIHGGEAALLFGLGDSVWEVNADGTCPTEVLHEAGVGFVGPSWRPGAEHAAAPIAC